MYPKRKSGGLAFTRPKTKKSQNPVPIPPPFIPYLHEHQARQEQMRTAAGDAWEEHKLVFTHPDGSRHIAGTILNELCVDTPRSTRPAGT